MQARSVWLLVLLGWFGITVLAYRAMLGAAIGAAPLGWLFGGGFFVTGVLLLGTVARWMRNGPPALWRPLMLGLGSLAAAGELALLPPPDGIALADLWMTALLGLLACAILARLLPDAVNHVWLGLERRAR